MSKVVVKGTLIVDKSELEKIRSALDVHVQLTLAEKGCLIFEVSEDPDRPGRFSVYEEFVDQAAFEQHQARAKKSEWMTVSQNVDRSFEVS